jgi:transcription-repair coupling factor (superfamily II helicase)
MDSKHYTGANLGLFANWLLNRDDTFLAVTPDRSSAETLYVNLESELEEDIVFLPDWEIEPNNPKLPGEAIQNQRLEVLSRLQSNQPSGIVLPVRALGHPSLSPDSMLTVSLTTGPSEGPQALAGQLSRLGFNRADLVEEPGDFSLRGDLLDFFPEFSEYPIRVSFFDQEIESIEYFHPSTHLQADEEPELPLELTLQSEFSLNPEERDRLRSTLQQHDRDKLSEELEYSQCPDEIVEWYGRWPRATVFPETLVDWSTIGVFRPSACWDTIKQWEEHRPDSLPAGETFRSLESIGRGLFSDSVQFSRHFQESPITTDTAEPVDGEPMDLSTAPGADASPISDFLAEISDLVGEVDDIQIHCGEDGFRNRMDELISDELNHDPEKSRSKLNLRRTPWHGSYKKSDHARLSLDDFFNRTISRGRIGPSRGKTEYLESFEELTPGDLVVHENFGIGRFHGLKRVSTEQQTRDCLLIEYRDDDKLYLPPDQIAWVQKYVADSGFTPTLSSLGNDQWERIKEDVQEEVSELAEDLLELYTLREDAETTPYPSDDLEQTQFEANFPHRETPDQKQAIEAVKQDLESTKPMDRLICGDSGFGKTEVALRAAFKVASSGRQVAMLVPTTVLTRQHYETFNQRFSMFPYRVEMLSRFQSESETKSILNDLNEGSIDVIVGTHSLLSERIEFQDLGLLIIDEEQRFGVEQKESLKIYKEDIDVLTLSATPIPRTLYMTLSGVQNISRINTPPEDRVPIDVNVSSFDEDTAEEAIDRELSRGGQVFWVHNRVKSINREAQTVRSLAPHATVEVAHGQMGKSELRNTMNRFYSGDIDVLVCTTIIESGLDCPSVNTMIIRNSHMFGLAQLYQLRGRVGRSHYQAYTHLFYPSQQQLTDDAEARLETIKQCSELGSGYNVAMRDMEIRGAGNLLGKKQHGNIRAVGFPFYCRLLQREIRKLREEFEVPTPYPKLKLPGEHYLPQDYIPDEEHRIRQYQELAACRKLEEVEDLKVRWRETFGELPEPAREVIRRHKFKIMADEEGWHDFRYQGNRLSMGFHQEPPQALIDAARQANATPSVRSNRLLINRFSTDKVSEWFKRLFERDETLEPVTN